MHIIAAIVAKNPRYSSHFEGDDLKRVLMIFPKDRFKIYDT